MTEITNIHQRMIAIAQAIGSIEKNETNTVQRFQFRGIDTVYNALHDIMAQEEVYSVPEVLAERSEERHSKAGGVLIYRVLTIRYTFYAPDGSSVQAIVIGEGMDSGDKASNKAMAVAHKYALLQVFTIPTAEAKDPDAESHEVAPRPVAKPKGGNPAVKKPAPTPRPVAKPKGGNPAEYSIPYGKHKGQLLGDVPLDYVQWLARSEERPGQEHSPMKMAAIALLAATDHAEAPSATSGLDYEPQYNPGDEPVDDDLPF